MNKSIFFLAALIAFASCKNDTTTKTEEVAVVTTPAREYPSEISKIFDAHGGIDAWNEKNNIRFTIPKGEIQEIYTVDTKSRKSTIETKDFTLGFDGEKVWLKQDTIAFEPKRAGFYHNLMFYFYAMPFVLGDEGITYSEVPALEMDGVSYPGTKISFNSGVGSSSDDNYLVFSDPTTNEMAWLAYTVTYGGDGPSDRYNYIKYASWEDVDGVKLPNEIHWYNVEEGQPTVMRNAVKFTNLSATNEQLDATTFAKPAEGEFVE